MSLTPAEARDAIQDAFNAAWGVPGSELTPIAYDNVPFDASKIDVPWVRLSIQFASGSIQTLGGVGERTFRNFGIVFVQVFTIAGSNAVINDGFAKTAKDVFKGVQLSAGGLWFRNTSIVTVGNEGKWYQQNVSAEFIYDETE
ncbi:MAG: phage tail terminator-like protein [Dehalococcoidales bacterium]